MFWTCGFKARVITQAQQLQRVSTLTHKPQCYRSPSGFQEFRHIAPGMLKETHLFKVYCTFIQWTSTKNGDKNSCSLKDSCICSPAVIVDVTEVAGNGSEYTPA